jgi:hypothetical protein
MARTVASMLREVVTDPDVLFDWSAGRATMPMAEPSQWVRCCQWISWLDVVVILHRAFREDPEDIGSRFRLNVRGSSHVSSGSSRHVVRQERDMEDEDEERERWWAWFSPAAGEWLVRVRVSGRDPMGPAEFVFALEDGVAVLRRSDPAGRATPTEATRRAALRELRLAAQAAEHPTGSKG